MIHPIADHHLTRTLTLLVSLGLLVACSQPIGISRTTPAESYRQVTRTPLAEEGLSPGAVMVLHRHNLLEAFDQDPEPAIRELASIAIQDQRRDILFTLAETLYQQGGALPDSVDDPELFRKRRDTFLEAAVYAYLFLLGPSGEPTPSPFDPRFREACEIYNRALAEGFRASDQASLALHPGPRHLTLGQLPIEIRSPGLAWKLDEFRTFQPADAFEVHGFTTHNRTPGLGLPIVAVTRESREAPNGGMVPVTAFLRIEGGARALSRGKARATLEIYSSYDEPRIDVNGQPVPLQLDTTTPLAYRLNDPDIWNAGLKRFIFGEELQNHMLFIQPYQPGKIPVVLVHGTGSSPVWWAEMVNSLRNDAVVRSRYQFWFYEYTSNLPVLLSAADLRDTLTSMVERLDPSHRDPALQEMVVIGHSQGGLLTHLTAVDPGDRFWRAISDRPPAELDLDPTIRSTLERMMFFEPLPFVKRLIFISTPHRGSFLTKNWVRTLASSLLTLPSQLLFPDPEQYRKFTGQLRLPSSLADHLPTSVDSMSSSNPILQRLAELPLAPGVTGHSIIAVLPGQAIKTGNDGVVEYTSAHLEGMASEAVVRTGHSAQGHPLTIEEVRRILLLHARDAHPEPGAAH